jgi:hypothetical protein
MPEYQLQWITDHLAVGHAPLSYDQLEAIRRQGISAIVNLCAEFCDLHEIEGNYGFEVYYLPVHDNEAPLEPELEKALAWLDEAVYLGKKVLVHCRHGIGRTGTFVTAYLLRRGFGMKLAKRKLENTRACHSSFAQWWLLHKYGKKSGKLTIREPSLESKHIVDLAPHFEDYEAVLARLDQCFAHCAASNTGLTSCGLDTDACCFDFVEMSLIEAVYLSHHVNRTLTSEGRQKLIGRALRTTGRIRELLQGLAVPEGDPAAVGNDLRQVYAAEHLRCPLSVAGKCQAYPYRPVRCRTHGLPAGRVDLGLDQHSVTTVEELLGEIDGVLEALSDGLLLALSACLPERRELIFNLPDVVSGRFIQVLFGFLASSPAKSE